MKVLIKNARLSFPDIRKPSSFQGGPMKFQETLIFSDDTIIKVEGKQVTVDGLLKAIDQVAVEKFGKVPPNMKNQAVNKADGSGTRGKVLDKDGNYKQGYDENTWYAKAITNADNLPGGIMILGMDGKLLPATSGHPVAGDYVDSIISVYAYDSPAGGKGVSASFDSIVFRQAGEAFGATPTGIDEVHDVYELDEVDDDEDESCI